MADISALSMISERMQIHERLVNSTDSSTTDLLAFSKEVSDVSNKTTNCAKDVAKYATRINEDLTKLRQLIKDFTVENGDKLKWKPSQKLDCLKVQKHKKTGKLCLTSSWIWINAVFIIINGIPFCWFQMFQIPILVGRKILFQI